MIRMIRSECNYIPRMLTMYMCLSCNVKKYKVTVKMSEKRGNIRRSNRFQLCALSRPP